MATIKAVNLVTEPRVGEDTLVIAQNLISQAAGQTPVLVVPVIFVKAGTPAGTSTVPTKAGDIYIDTTNSKVYIAKAATAAADFLILN